MEEWTTAFKEGKSILREIPGVLQLKEGDSISIDGILYNCEGSIYNLDFKVLVHFVNEDVEEDDDWV